MYFKKKNLKFWGSKFIMLKKTHKTIPNRWSMVATLFFHSNWLVPLCQRLRQAKRGNDKVVFQSPFWYGLIVGGRNPAPPAWSPTLTFLHVSKCTSPQKIHCFLQLFKPSAKPYTPNLSSPCPTLIFPGEFKRDESVEHVRAAAAHVALQVLYSSETLYHPDFWQSQSPPKDCKLGMLS